MRIKDFGKIRNEISDVFPAYLPAVVLFILMPFALYLPNQSVFDYNLTLVIPYLVLAVFYFIFLVTLFLFVGQPWRTRIVIVLFYLGLYLGLSDVLSPVQMGELTGGRETPNEPLLQTVIEVVLAVVVIISAIKLPWKRVKRFGSVFILILLISEVIVVFSGLLPETSLHFSSIHFNTIKKTADPPEKLAEGGNIYHITLDAYSGAIFLESIEEMKSTEEFGGFTFFRKNRSNYGSTRVSLPSYMTGSFYEENDSLKEWRERHRSSGIAKNLYDAGYEISMYTPTSWWVNHKASHVKTYEDMLMRYKSLSSLFCQFADLWLVRVVPNFLQQEVYWEGKGSFTRVFVKEDSLAGENAKILASVQIMRQLIDDEVKRPDHGQYVYAHIHVPHNPFIMDRDCVFSSEDVDYHEQALCATKLMSELISKLKELGRYHASTIIFQSDHGWDGIKDIEYDMPLEIEKKVDGLNPTGFPARSFNSRTHSLLLIKPPSHSGEPLVISERLTQLVDIPATIYDFLGLRVQVKEGMSVFSSDFPIDREVHMFIGFRQLNGNGKIEGLREGQVCHLSFTNSKGWKIYPSIPVRWE
jgi:hypothetical protein